MSEEIEITHTDKGSHWLMSIIILIITGGVLFGVFHIKRSYNDDYNNLLMEANNQVLYDATTINSFKDYIERKYDAKDVKIDLVSSSEVVYTGEIKGKSFKISIPILDEKELINGYEK